MTHARAKLTVAGRLLLVQRVLELGWTVTMAAEAQGCSAATGYKWLRRFRTEGHEGLRDRSSRPHRTPARLSPHREQAILARREATLEGPHRIAWALGEAPSTVHRVLRRLGAPTAARPRPTHPGGRALRARAARRARARRHQEAGPDPGGWRLEGPRPGGRPSQRTEATATTSSTPRSMIAPVWPTPRSCPTSARRPPRGS